MANFLEFMKSGKSAREFIDASVLPEHPIPVTRTELSPEPYENDELAMQENNEDVIDTPDTDDLESGIENENEAHDEKSLDTLSEKETLGEAGNKVFEYKPGKFMPQAEDYFWNLFQHHLKGKVHQSADNEGHGYFEVALNGVNMQKVNHCIKQWTKDGYGKAYTTGDRNTPFFSVVFEIVPTIRKTESVMPEDDDEFIRQLEALEDEEIE